jgi:hypothetical protein
VIHKRRAEIEVRLDTAEQRWYELLEAVEAIN